MSSTTSSTRKPAGKTSAGKPGGTTTTGTTTTGDGRIPGFDDLAAQATKAAKDALYVSVGFGVLAFQQAQTRRHEFAAAFESSALPTVRKGLDLGKEQIDRLAAALDRPLGGLDDTVTAVEARVDALLDAVQHKLPDPAAGAFGQLRSTAKLATTQVRDLVRSGA